MNTTNGDFGSYVDGFVVPVPAAKRAEYLAMAELSAAVFKDHGATHIVECWGDDVPDGKLTSFPMSVKLEADEVPVFSWIRWPSRAVRDVGMKAAMEDPRMQLDMSLMPFDSKRMIFGGFQILMER